MDEKTLRTTGPALKWEDRYRRAPCRHGIIPAATRWARPHSLLFVADNILTSALQEPYDLITDRGCYTLLQDWMRDDYCRNVHRLLSPDGLFLLKIDAKKKGNVDSLASLFRIEKTWDTDYQGGGSRGPLASFFIMKPLSA